MSVWGRAWREPGAAALGLAGAGLDRVQRWIAAEGIQVRAVKVAEFGVNDGRDLEGLIALDLHAPGPKSTAGIRPLTFARRHINVEVLSGAVTFHAIPAEERPLTVSRGWPRPVALRRGQAWGDMTVQLRVLVRSSAPNSRPGTGLLLLPDHVPWPIGADETANASRLPHPLPPVCFDSLPDAMLAGFLNPPDAALAPRSNVSLVLAGTQGALVPARNETMFSVSATLASERPRDSITSAVEVLVHAQQFFAERLCSLGASRIALVSSSELGYATVEPFGPLVVLASPLLAPGAEDDGVHQANLVRRIAGLWWGASVRVTGPGAAELMAGVRFALSIAWLRQCGQTGQADTYVRHLQALSRRMRALDRLDHARGFVGRQATATVALQVVDHLASPLGWTDLATLTRASMGQCVSSSEIRARLRLEPER